MSDAVTPETTEVEVVTPTVTEEVGTSEEAPVVTEQK